MHEHMQSISSLQMDGTRRCLRNHRAHKDASLYAGFCQDVGACETPIRNPTHLARVYAIYNSTMSYPRPLLRLRYPQATARLRVCAQAISPCIRRPLSTEAKRALRTDKLRTSSIPKRYFVYLFTLSLGLGAGLFVRTFANARFDPPIPGSEEDAVALEALGDQMEELKVVKALRGQGYQVNRKSIFQGTGNQTGGWVELDTQQDINKGITRTLTEQAVAGIQGLGVQRAFWNSQTRELVGVIWIGPRLSGWPGLAHGGAIATVFEDAMSMMIAGPDVDRGTYINDAAAPSDD